MNHKHRVALNALFTHPVSNNINLRVVKSTQEDTGAEISHGGHGRLIVKLNDHTHGFHDSSRHLTKEDVAALQKFLTLAGGNPARNYPLQGAFRRGGNRFGARKRENTCEKTKDSQLQFGSIRPGNALGQARGHKTELPGTCYFLAPR
jgi:hypothetical protein